MRTAIVPGAGILGTEGVPLVAAFYVERRPGEPLASWRVRQQIARTQDAMDLHLDRAARAAARIVALTATVPPEFRDYPEDDQEGR